MVEPTQVMDRYVLRFLQYLEAEKNASPHTLKNYQSDLKEFFNFLGHETSCSITDVNYLSVRSFLALLKGKNFLKTTISRKLACLRSFFKFLARERIITSNPAGAIATPKRERQLPEFLEIKEVEQLIDSTQGNSWETKRDRAIIETLYSSGIRVT